MSSKYSEFDFDFDDTDLEEERNGMFDSLFLEDFQFCPECGYEGTLILRRRGYVCPECKNLILEHR